MESLKGIFAPRFLQSSVVLPPAQKFNVGLLCKEKRTTFYNPEVVRLVRASNGLPVFLSDSAIQKIKEAYEENGEMPLLVVPSRPSCCSLCYGGAAGCGEWCQRYCDQCLKECFDCERQCMICCNSCYRVWNMCRNFYWACKTPHFSDSAFVRGIWFGKKDAVSKMPGFLGFFGPGGLLFCSDVVVDYCTGQSLDYYCPESILEAFRRLTVNEFVRKRVYILPEDVAMAPILGFDPTEEIVNDAFAEQARLRILLAEENAKRYPVLYNQVVLRARTNNSNNNNNSNNPATNDANGQPIQGADGVIRNQPVQAWAPAPAPAPAPIIDPAVNPAVPGVPGLPGVPPVVAQNPLFVDENE